MLWRLRRGLPIMRPWIAQYCYFSTEKMNSRNRIHYLRDFSRRLFWFLSPWLALIGGAIVLIPITTQMPGRSHEGPAPPLTDTELVLRGRLRSHVDQLAGHIGERNMRRYNALQEAARYIEEQLITAGYSVTSETYQVDDKPVRNLVAFLQPAIPTTTPRRTPRTRSISTL